MRCLRPSWLEVDLDAARANLAHVRRLIGPERKLFAVVKADGYGFGAEAMGRAFLEAGADALAVADGGEGVRLRDRGVDAPILVMARYGRLHSAFFIPYTPQDYTYTTTAEGGHEGEAHSNDRRGTDP